MLPSQKKYEYIIFIKNYITGGDHTVEKSISCITQAIGKTPLLRLDRIKAHVGFEGNIYAKLEHLNPSFSKKDRIALGMLELAEKKGLLKPGQTVLEMTSGNTDKTVSFRNGLRCERIPFYLCYVARKLD